MFGLGSLGSEDQNQESGSASGSSESDSAGSRRSVSGSGLVPEAKLLGIPRARGIDQNWFRCRPALTRQSSVSLGRDRHLDFDELTCSPDFWWLRFWTGNV